jgi:transcription factor 15
MVKRDEDFTAVNNGKETELRGESKVKKKRRRRRKPRLTGLSKERQTANARERTRMRSISDALLHLRYHLPSTVVPKDQKLSKIQTLRLAIGYIADLWQIVKGTDGLHVLDDVSEKKTSDEEEETNEVTSTSSSSVDNALECSETECIYCDDAYFTE